MTKYLCLLIFILPVHYHGSGQVFSSFNPLFPGDTLVFNNVPMNAQYQSLDSLPGKCIDTVEGLSAFIYKLKKGEYFDYSIAVKNKNGWSLYPILTSRYHYDSLLAGRYSGTGFPSFPFRGECQFGSILKIFKYRFSNTPADFLIIQYAETKTYSYSSGWRSIQNGYQVWDTGSWQMLQLINDKQFENWPYGDGMVATNSGMNRFYKYGLSFINGLIRINAAGKIKNYQYHSGKFIKK